MAIAAAAKPADVLLHAFKTSTLVGGAIFPFPAVCPSVATLASGVSTSAIVYRDSLTKKTQGE